MSRDQLLQAALTLAPAERVALSVALLESLEPAEEGVEDAWRAEIERRIAEVDRGEVELIPAEDVFRELGRRFDP